MHATCIHGKRIVSFCGLATCIAEVTQMCVQSKVQIYSDPLSENPELSYTPACRNVLIFRFLKKRTQGTGIGSQGGSYRSMYSACAHTYRDTTTVKHIYILLIRNNYRKQHYLLRVCTYYTLYTTPYT